MEETFETNFDEGDSHAWLGDGFDEEEEAQEQEFDYLEDEEEAIALNAMLDIEEADDRQAGEAIQLQLAAFKAFGKAKGKGKGKGFGKKGFTGKGKGKVVRSQTSIEQRRAKLRELKSKSKCLRCGGMGHWAGDPGCEFANKPQPPKPTANLAYESEPSDGEGFIM